MGPTDVAADHTEVLSDWTRTIVTVHGKNGWMFSNKDGGWEYPVFLAVAAGALALIGGGAYTAKDALGSA